LGIISLRPAHLNNHEPSDQYRPKEEAAGLSGSPIPGDNIK
jgi:hypothetical protein